MMKAIILLAALLVVSSVAGSSPAPPHSSCYAFFLNKDKCVYSSGVPGQRCGHKPHLASAVGKLSTQYSLEKRGVGTLMRRYDDGKTAPHITKDRLVYTCPGINPSQDKGACVWVGDAESTSNTGWLNKHRNENCGKQIYIQRQGETTKVQYGKIIGACHFYTADPLVGCMDIALNQKLFDALEPTPDERRTGKLKTVMTWDWNNEQGTKPENAPN